MTFSVSEIGLTTLLPHSVSILREKLCKVDIKCNNDMFFNFLALFLKINIFEVFDIFFSPTINHKNSEANAPPPNINVVWRCGCIWVDSFCHSGTLYLRHNIELGGWDIRIGIYCTLSNVFEISTGFD